MAVGPDLELPVVQERQPACTDQGLCSPAVVGGLSATWSSDFKAGHTPERTVIEAQAPAGEVNGGHQQRTYEVVGFLKPLHGVSLHGVLVLPALAWMLSFTDWDEARRTRVVAFSVAGYGLAILVALTYSLA
jgi:hypothetical protein